MDNQVMRPGINDQSPSTKAKSKHTRAQSTDSTGIQQPINNLAPTISILKKTGGASKDDTQRIRNDSVGNRIKQGGKKHKLVFKENLCEVVEIESYKQYNAEDDLPNQKSCCNIM